LAGARVPGTALQHRAAPPKLRLPWHAASAARHIPKAATCRRKSPWCALRLAASSILSPRPAPDVLLFGHNRPMRTQILHCASFMIRAMCRRNWVLTRCVLRRQRAHTRSATPATKSYDASMA
jgi:hypothetical protein